MQKRVVVFRYFYTTFSFFTAAMSRNTFDELSVFLRSPNQDDTVLKFGQRADVKTKYLCNLYVYTGKMPGGEVE